MTRDEAIFVLEHIEAHGSLAIKAKEMAIEALKQEPCDDAISRQAAKEAFFDDNCIDYTGREVRETIKDLPSVQPISHDCDNCEKVTKAYFDGQYYADSIEADPCDDAISRQAVMRVLDEIGSDFDSPRNAVVSLDGIADAIQDLPSVKPQEPKTGHLIERRSKATGHIESVCSECGAEEGYPYNDYCGNCGARMVEPQERSE